MALIGWLLLLGSLAGAGWLARERRLRARRQDRVHEVLLQLNVSGDRFDSDSLDHLPVPAARFLHHSIGANAPLARTVDIRMSGSMRVGNDDDWVPFEARQRVCAERGFIWQARLAALRRLTLEGADWMFGDEAGSEYALADWWPVVNQRGDDVARSAAGRLMVELIWLPSALTPQRGASWSRGDADRAVVTPAGSSTPLTILVAENGAIREASIVRRQLSPGGEISVAPYGVSVEAEERCGDFTVPTRVVAAWGIGTDDRRDFLRATVDDIRWL